MAHYIHKNTQGVALGYVLLGLQPALIEFLHTLLLQIVKLLFLLLLTSYKSTITNYKQKKQI